jgi:hypothetical protein
MQNGIDESLGTRGAAMRKLRLNHEDLKVESFIPSDEGYSRGTVIGEDSEGPPQTWNYGDWACQSYQYTCYNRGCINGLTNYCGTAGVTECPGQTDCPPYSEGYTCAGSCTDVQGCTFCGAVC